MNEVERDDEEVEVGVVASGRSLAWAAEVVSLVETSPQEEECRDCGWGAGAWDDMLAEVLLSQRRRVILTLSFAIRLMACWSGR